MISLPEVVPEGTHRGGDPADTPALPETNALLQIVRTMDHDDNWLSDIAEKVAEHLEASSLRIWSLSPDSRRLLLRLSVGIPVPFEALQDDLPVEQGELGHVFQTGTTCLVDCTSETTPREVRLWADTQQITSFFALPIRAEDRPWGVLGLFTRLQLSPSEQEVLFEITRMIGQETTATNMAPGQASPPDLLSSLVPCLASAVITLDQQGRVMHWNGNAERLFGFSEQQVLYKPLPIVPEERRHEFATGAAADGTNLRVNRSRTFCRRADLELIPVQRTSGPLFGHDGQVLGRVEVFTDDSHREQMTRCLQVQSQVARILAGCRGLEDGLPLLLSALGEWLGCEFVEFWKPHDDRQRLSRAAVWARSCADQERLSATDIVLKADTADWPARMFRQNHITRVEHLDEAARYVRDGSHQEWTDAPDALAVPVFRGDDRMGVITCFKETFQTPDEQTSQTLRFVADTLAQFLTRLRTQAELNRSEADRRQSQKMDAIGLLAGGVAHDFNNLLTVILAYSEMGLDEVDAGHPLYELFEEIHGAGERAARMTQQLLAVSRQQPTKAVACDLNQLVEEMERMLQRLLGAQITLSFDPTDDLASVCADRNQLEQVLLNLVVNARDAMPQGGAITISTRNVPASAVAMPRRHQRAQRFVKLSVTDTGCGMDEATRSRIFEPFFTTKEVGRGTGMGLSTVFGIVKQAGGHIEVQSQPDAGTTFSVYLPEDHSALATQLIDVPLERSPNGSEAILIVEHDDAVRALIRRLLEVRGYTIVDAADGAEALQFLNRKRPSIDLVLTDAQSPGVEKLISVCRAEGRKTVIPLVMTSTNADRSGESGMEMSCPCLRKPFTSDQLARHIRQALDAENAGPLST